MQQKTFLISEDLPNPENPNTKQSAQNVLEIRATQISVKDKKGPPVFVYLICLVEFFLGLTGLLIGLVADSKVLSYFMTFWECSEFSACLGFLGIGVCLMAAAVVTYLFCEYVVMVLEEELREEFLRLREDLNALENLELENKALDQQVDEMAETYLHQRNNFYASKERILGGVFTGEVPNIRLDPLSTTFRNQPLNDKVAQLNEAYEHLRHEQELFLSEQKTRIGISIIS